MKLRYYMRGLGIGILVTAILMSVTLNGKTEKLTDEQIVARAEELGMVPKYDDVVLADTVSDNQTEEAEPVDEAAEHQEADQEEDPQELQSEPETDGQESETEEQEPESEEESEIQEESEPEEPQAEDGTQIEEIETDRVVQITVQGGDGSMTVSRKLKDAGLIEDVNAYDRYLCTNGYDKRICTGTHSIPVGASEEEIAKILTTRPN